LVDTKKYNEWFGMALKDLNGAKILFEHDADFGLVCFHCQQVIEKYFKGYLIFKTGRLYEGHSLIKLCKFAMEHESGFGQFLKDCSFVNSFYIETRYPAEDPIYVSKEDTVECIRIAEDIIAYVNGLLYNNNR